MTSGMNLSAALAVAPLVLLLNSCGTHQTALRGVEPAVGIPSAADVEEAGYSYWSDHPAEAPLRVRIDLSEQTAYFHRGEVFIGQSRVATGRAGHSTPTGSFTITERIPDKRSNLYGRIYDADGNVVVGDADTRRDPIPEGGRFEGAPMPCWMRLTSHGVGMHVGPIPNPGLPASHGCIRMPEEMARVLFENAPAGTMVVIEQ